MEPGEEALHRKAGPVGVKEQIGYLGCLHPKLRSGHTASPLTRPGWPGAQWAFLAN